MKKFTLILCLILLVSAFSFSQNLGSIRGKVIDNGGKGLPGVVVTLTGQKTAPRSTVTSEEGNFRFLNLAGGFYALKLELQGFKTLVREQLNISYGHDPNLELVLEQAAIDQQITVVGQTPVINSKKTQVGINVSEEMIMSLPTSRNPWVMLALAPGLLMDREDVGGSDAGSQSTFYGHGSAWSDNSWSVDGVDITDVAAVGSYQNYLNLSGYEEMQINYGNNDINSQTGGVQLNFITKRGGNAYSGVFYLDAEQSAWQSENITSELKARGYKGVGINKVYLYGANFGGPIIKDRAWFYGSYGIQDLDTRMLTGLADPSWLAAGYARLDIQFSANTRLTGLFEHDDKTKWNRMDWGPTLQSPDTYYNQTGPIPMYKIEVEQMFENLLLVAKYSHNRGGFHWTPVLGPRTSDGSGPYQVNVYSPTEWHYGNTYDYQTVRPTSDASLTGNYFAEKVLGADHEIKFGVDYTTSSWSATSLIEGNLSINDYGDGWVEAWLVRDWYRNLDFTRASAFLQDTFSFGKLAINLGLRYDVEGSKVANTVQPASPWLPQYLARLEVQEFDPGIKSKVFSPRLSLIYDIRGNGKDVIKLNVARYGTRVGYEFATLVNPTPWAEIDLRWVDSNGDGRVTSNELFGTDWATGEPTVDPNDPNGWSYYGGFNPSDPTKVASTNKFDPNYKTPLLDEVSLSYEKELFADFAASLGLFYKKRHRFAWNKGILADGTVETKDNWYLGGTDPVSNQPYYLRKARPVGTYRTNANNAYERYLGIEIVLKKRLTNRWMMDGSFTYSDWTYHYNGDYDFDLTNHDYYDGGVLAPASGGSGFVNVFVNARWQAKLSGLYQFPYGINASATFFAREGYVYPTYSLLNRPKIGWTNMYGHVGSAGTFGDTRLPNFFEMNLRLEKTFNISETATVTLSADAFNVLNANTTLARNGMVTSPQFEYTQRILNPRVFRFGVRFNL